MFIGIFAGSPPSSWRYSRRVISFNLSFMESLETPINSAILKLLNMSDSTFFIGPT
ncbi:MAG: hypothetical protein ABIF85_04815 [Nanoarchaeota archaeon]|nr:hypothetical protein [Nanoarchaeota archaeon]MBU4299920.1 hypothetical protein [Nanoarchaeota archaeon]MBU4451660.1 hypothetical protein [Nanoarchaeota archaeon]MCG2724575.1 hypothetical protein [archaeon]